ncbi:MAG: metalloregulator ArsR/SmtB family transcription factor [Thermoanaerobaculia bacterium]
MITHAKRDLPEIVSSQKVRAARHGLPAPEVLGEAAEVFRLLANPVRLSLMHALAHAELTVGDIAHALDLSLSATSHQLALLRRMRLITSRDEGRLTYYRATDEFVGHLVHDCLAHVGEAHGIRARRHHRPHRKARSRGKSMGPAR